MANQRLYQGKNSRKASLLLENVFRILTGNVVAPLLSNGHVPNGGWGPFAACIPVFDLATKHPYQNAVAWG